MSEVCNEILNVLVRFCDDAQTGNTSIVNSSKHSPSVRLFHRRTDPSADKTSLLQCDHVTADDCETRLKGLSSQHLPLEVCFSGFI